MKIAILGRTDLLIRTTHRLLTAGHEIVFVGTKKPAEFYSAGYDEYRDLADRCKAAFEQTGNINSDEYVAKLKRSGAEIGISINWPTIIGDAPINTLRYGILNAHAGDLPRYRGNACPNWAIINGEHKIGLCVHAMVPNELDNGPVYERDYYEVSRDTYIGDVYGWLEEAIPELFLRAIDNLSTGTFSPEIQSPDPALSLRCYPRRPEDSKIMWDNDAETTLRLIRASSRPFAGAFTLLEDGTRLTVWRASVHHHAGPFCAIPGQVMYFEAKKPIIACRESCLKLDEFEFQGDTSSNTSQHTIRLNTRSRFY